MEMCVGVIVGVILILMFLLFIVFVIPKKFVDDYLKIVLTEKEYEEWKKRN